MNRKIILIILIIVSFTGLTYSQTYYVFKNDTTVIEKLPYIESYNGIYGKDFKDKLPDGKWLYYNVEDSTAKDWKQHLLIEGTYKDSLRHGKFIYTSLSPALRPKTFAKKRKTLFTRKFVTYKNGVLDGVYCRYWFGTKMYEGTFNNGLKDGFFVTYYTHEYKGIVRRIEFFENGILKDWVCFSETGEFVSKGYGEINKSVNNKD